MWSKIFLGSSTLKSIKFNENKVNKKTSQQIKPFHKTKIKKGNP